VTHDELLKQLSKDWNGTPVLFQALYAVVELHKPEDNYGGDVCKYCFDMAWERSGLSMDNKQFNYPCPTIQAIEKELA
jgi:hypothetical protein